MCELTCPGSVSSDYKAEFHDWQIGFFRLHADFHEGHGTVEGSRDIAWYVGISLNSTSANQEVFEF